MADERHEARENLPNEAESSSPMFMALLKEMRAINTNITSMHEDINNLVVVNEDPASEMPGNEGDVDADVAEGDAEREGNDNTEIINNTREGIVVCFSGNKRERGDWGANSSPGCRAKR